MAEKRQTCRLRFCALRQIFFITARDCGKGEVNVPFAVLHFKANALTARVCGKGEVNVPFAVLHFTANAFVTARLRQRSGKRAVCGFARCGECFYNRMRLRQRRSKCAACGFAR